MISKATELSTRIAKRVRFLRMERNWSQPDLARSASLSNAMVSMVERGERTPSLEALEALATALEVEPALLLSNSEEGIRDAGSQRLASELASLGLRRSDVEALRRIARALAGERQPNGRKRQ